MTLSEFEDVVFKVVKLLPRKFKDQLDNVDIVVEAWPGEDDLARVYAGKHTLLFGLYTGVPKTKRGAYYSTVPDKITIFAGPVLYVAQSLEEAKKMIRSTVLHEIGHHFGMSEDQIRKAEASRE